jgi:SAM-dependent methyltransferase
MQSKFDISKSISDYYTDKISKHGPTPAGVDWNDHDGQFLRFEQLINVIRPCELEIDIAEFGCGYGALLSFVSSQFNHVTFEGFDLSSEMIKHANDIFSSFTNATFHVNSSPLRTHDYCLASGIFNVKFGFDTNNWTKHVISTIDIMNMFSKKGFSFNSLSIYSDVDKQRPELYYADPLLLFHHCKVNYSKYVTLIHDYPLYEFTIIVRK